MSEEATKEEGSFKIKKKPTMKKLGKPNEVTKINLPSKPPVVETEATKVVIPSVKVEDKNQMQSNRRLLLKIKRRNSRRRAIYSNSRNNRR